ncbi:hypothetical protein Gogos_016971 [Gossypium gossypioides]|uniref:Uncharacterized protein n=1 Tax=Gossypium gossypioides TaxID=34282 RepID=A0A7J9B9S7_GOSGO|nr:hypothetical protein [Gossypium gossypioides]
MSRVFIVEMLNSTTFC